MTFTLDLADAGVTIDPRVGMLSDLWFQAGARRIAPLHRAHWVGTPAAEAPGLPPVERHLAGDFFCAPFADADPDGAPIHGFPANSVWGVDEITRSGRSARAVLRLDRAVMGATLTKEVLLAQDVPVLTQVHRITGGQGRLSVGHHPMVHMAAGGWLSFSPKRAILTPAVPLVAGRNWLACPALGHDLSAFPAAAGGNVDLHRFPAPPAMGVGGHEDFVALAEAPVPDNVTPGWTVVIREAEDDLIFILKDPAVLPATMLWYSNGGRDFAPWNGRHTGVLGIEDACASGVDGLAAAQGRNPVAATGVPTVLELGGSHVVRHAIGAVPRPPGWTRIADIAVTGTGLTLREAGGGRLHLAVPREMLPV